MLGSEQVVPADWGVGGQSLAHHRGLVGLEVQSRLAMAVDQLRPRSAERGQPVRHPLGFGGGAPDAGRHGAAIGRRSRPFGPQPGRRAGAEQLQHLAGDAALSAGVEQVVDRAQPGAGDPVAQHGGALAVGTLHRSVGNNRRLIGQELAHFGGFFLQKGGLLQPGRQGQLDVAASRGAVGAQAAVGEQHTQQATHIGSVQGKFRPTNCFYSTAWEAACPLSRTLFSLERFIPCGLTTIFRSC